MAMQIKSTPTLYGKDALIFEKTAKENIDKKASKQEVLESLNIFKKVTSKSKNIL